VFFFLDSDDSEYFHPSSPYFKLMNFLQPRPDEPVIVKTSRNCFTTTNLDFLLRRADVTRVVITGIKTEQCCETTTRVASDLGYDVDFVTEATLTFPISHPDLGEEMPAEEVVRRTEYALRNRFARINTVDAILEELEEVAASCKE
jgi:nicotinamidase-related amidase